MNAWVYDRTSGDEASTGQDSRAQLAMTVGLASENGLNVVGKSTDADVSGDVAWEKRPALRRARGSGALVFVREVSRLWRGDPAQGLILIESIPNLEVAFEPGFARRDGAWVQDESTDTLVRFIALWKAWDEKRTIQTRTQQAMDELASGRRAPKNGRRPGRPSIVDRVTEDELAWCRAQTGAGAPLTQVHRGLLERRGYHDVVKPDAKKKRAISYDTLARALKGSAKPEVPQNSETPTENEVSAKGPLVRSQKTNDTNETRT